ncbi:MAG: hypothetical protein WC624_01210 [Candidatus Margulisiibacteriota bacterium]
MEFIKDNDNDREFAYKYAWDWFKHHAEQRYWAFNYFLLVIGALAYGYSQVKCDEWPMRVAIGVFGLVISLAFLFIEKRNNTLVNDGRAALRDFEKKYIKLGKDNEFDGFMRYEEDNRLGCPWNLICHKFWFRSVIIASFGASIFAIIYALKPRIIYYLSCFSGYLILITLIIMSFFSVLYFCLKERFWEG